MLTSYSISGTLKPRGRMLSGWLLIGGVLPDPDVVDLAAAPPATVRP